jgi:hypothetical protein
MNHDSAVGTETGYGLGDRGVGVPSPGRAKILLHVVHAASEAYSVSYLFPRG